MNALRNDLLARELETVLKAFRDVGIAVIRLKGPPLADSPYKDRKLRVCSDLDILVPPERVSQAFHRMLELGYQGDLSGWVLTNQMMRNCIEYPLRRQEREIKYFVEIPWALHLQASAAAQLRDRPLVCAVGLGEKLFGDRKILRASWK